MDGCVCMCVAVFIARFFFNIYVFGGVLCWLCVLRLVNHLVEPVLSLLPCG